VAILIRIYAVVVAHPDKTPNMVIETIFGAFLFILFNLQSAHQGQYLNNIQTVKATPVLYF